MSRLSSTNRGSSLATGAPVWHKFRLGFCSVTEYGCPVRQALGMEFFFVLKFSLHKPSCLLILRILVFLLLLWSIEERLRKLSVDVSGFDKTRSRITSRRGWKGGSGSGKSVSTAPTRRYERRGVQRICVRWMCVRRYNWASHAFFQNGRNSTMVV